MPLHDESRLRAAALAATGAQGGREGALRALQVLGSQVPETGAQLINALAARLDDRVQDGARGDEARLDRLTVGALARACAIG